MKHIMLDLETMSSDSYAAIISIAAVEFDIVTGNTGRQFYQNVSLASSKAAGLVVSKSTQDWWKLQSLEAQTRVKQNTVTLTKALDAFSKFCTKEYEIWGNSARFDCGILQNAYAVIGKPIPWDFRKERCVRTLVSFNPALKDSVKFVGVAHDPIDDCKHQIKYCSAVWNSLLVTY